MGRAARSFTITMTGALCCCPLCLRLHRHLKSRETVTVDRWNEQEGTKGGQKIGIRTTEGDASENKHQYDTIGYTGFENENENEQQRQNDGDLELAEMIDANNPFNTTPFDDRRWGKIARNDTLNDVYSCSSYDGEVKDDDSARTSLEDITSSGFHLQYNAGRNSDITPLVDFYDSQPVGDHFVIADDTYYTGTSSNGGGMYYDSSSTGNSRISAPNNGKAKSPSSS